MAIAMAVNSNDVIRLLNRSTDLIESTVKEDQVKPNKQQTKVFTQGKKTTKKNSVEKYAVFYCEDK